MKTTPNRFEKYLSQVLEKEKGTIAAFLAEIALEEPDAYSFFKDLCNYGCSSGIIGQLVYYSDTHDFFDKYYKEIEQVREEYQIVVPTDYDLKNYLAWAVVEIVAYQIYQVYEEGL